MRFPTLVRLRPLFAAACLLSAASCMEPTEPANNQPIVPTTLNGRPVEVQGTATVNSHIVTFNVWDSGAIDGDIISLNVNGNWVLQQYTLTGTKKPISVTLNKSGYSYVALFAHNEGSSPPNTAALSLNDGTSEQTLVLSANLTTNAAYNLVVR